MVSWDRNWFDDIIPADDYSLKGNAWEILSEVEEHFEQLRQRYPFPSTGPTAVRDRISIKFSDDIESAPSFARSEDRIKKELEKLPHSSADAVGDRLKRDRRDLPRYSWEEKDYSDLYDPVRRRLGGELKAATSIKLGEYRASYSKKKIGTIVIYRKAICKCARDHDWDRNHLFQAVLAHESFHAYQFSCLKEKGYAEQWKSPGVKKERTVVQESLAAAYEWYFCDSVMKDERICEWKEMDIDFWPYSGALGMIDSTPEAFGLKPDAFSRWALDICFEDWRTPAMYIRIAYDKAWS